MTEPNVTAPGPKRQSSNNKNNKPKDNPKENNSAKITDDKKSGSRSSKRIATQITFKVVIRKLPSKDYGMDQFRESLLQFLEKLQLDMSDVHILHFMEGKLSRKRGPVPGACFLSFKKPQSFHMFASVMKSGEIPFLIGESPECQPCLEVAVYQRVEERDRQDKLQGTIESSSDYKAFCEQLDAPTSKLPTAEARLVAGESLSSSSSLTDKEKDPKMSALIMFLREKGRKQMELAKLKKKAKDSVSKGRPIKDTEDTTRPGKSGSSSKRAASKPFAAPASAKFANASSEQPKPMAKVKILQREPSSNNIPSDGRNAAKQVEKPSERQGDNIKKPRGDQPSSSAINKDKAGVLTPSTSFKKQGEERKKKREKLRSGTISETASYAEPPAATLERGSGIAAKHNRIDNPKPLIDGSNYPPLAKP